MFKHKKVQTKKCSNIKMFKFKKCSNFEKCSKIVRIVRKKNKK
jgi:hypothetical protein